MSTEMRILTVRQPWAWAIIHGGKDVENRVRNLAGDYCGPVAIHAGLATFEDTGQYREVTRAIVSEQNGWEASDSDLWAADGIEPTDQRFAYGAIVGVIDLDHGHHANQCWTGFEDRNGNDHEELCSKWAEEDVFHLILTTPRPLRTPIPYKGALGLRRLDTTTIDLIQKELS